MTTHWYVNPDASGSNNGTSEANAWTSLASALTKSTYSDADMDIIWVRRNKTCSITSSPVTVGDYGTAQKPIYLCGVPRASAAITAATWTINSTAVSSVTGVTLSSRSHAARYVTGPDGKDYLIQAVLSTSSFSLMRPYAGPSVSGASGAATIKADVPPVAYPTSGSERWDNDASQEMPQIDFGTSGNYYINHDGKSGWGFRFLKFYRGSVASSSAGNMNLKGSAYGVPGYFEFIGCLFEQSNTSNNMINCANGGFGTPFFLYLESCCAYGNQGSGQNFFNNHDAVACLNVQMRNCALYYLGIGMTVNYVNLLFENVRFGYPSYNNSVDLVWACGTIRGTDVYFGSTITTYNQVGKQGGIFIENKDFVLGKHWKKIIQGTIESVVAGASGEAKARSGGSDTLVKITPSGQNILPVQSAGFEVFCLEYLMPAGESKTWNYYVQFYDSGSSATLAATNLWLELEYIDEYDETTGIYHVARVLSTSTVAYRTGDTDWTEKLSISGINPAVNGKVRVRCLLSYYSASNLIWIDPKVEWT